jgi:hypothetical protein
MVERPTKNCEESIARERAAELIDCFRFSFPQCQPNRNLFDAYLNRISKRIDVSRLESSDNGNLVFTYPPSFTLIIVNPAFISWSWVLPGSETKHDIEKSVVFYFDEFGHEKLKLTRVIDESKREAIIDHTETVALKEDGIERKSSIPEINKLFPKPK